MQGDVTIHLVFLIVIQDRVKELDPGMLQNFRDRDPLLWVHDEHSANEVLDFARQLRGDRGREIEPAVDNKVVQFMHTLSLERYGAAYHGIKKYTQAPYICSETLIAAIRNNLRSNVCWSAALFRDFLVFLNNSAYAEITYLNIAIFIQKDIVKLDVPVEHRPAMAVSNTISYLLEYSSSLALIESPPLFNELQQISATSILHHHEQVLGRFEDFKESYDVGMAHLLQDLHFL